MISNGAVVGNVRVGEEISMATNACFRAWQRASVDCAKFAKGIVVSDFEIGRLNRVFKILRALTNRAVGIKNIPLTDACGPTDRNMTNQSRAFANLDLRANMAKRPHLNILMKDG